jgi:hypothetical protein
LDFPRTKVHLFVSWLQQWDLLEIGVEVSFYKRRQSNIVKYFSMAGNPVYCNVCGLMEELQLQHVPGQWRLFIDSSS